MTFLSRYSLGGAAVLSLFLIAKCGFDWFAGPIFSAERISRVEFGMKKEDVEDILGTPSFRDKEDRYWDYERLGNPGWVRVEFDRNGGVLVVENESASWRK